jgi:hypothetical protein
MSEFLTPIDIGNRALQHCGVALMSDIDGFNEDSKNARQVSFAYGKLRRAELRANVWSFATRRAVLRPLAVDTRFLMPTLWVAETTYFLGSIVSDENNNLWISKIANNLGYQPQGSLMWEPYFGPLTVSKYDSSTSYNSGELVYTTAGDGTFRVYLSLQSGNSDNPATATAWTATATYMVGNVVTYLGTPYMSRIDFNIGQTPTASPADWSAASTYAIGNTVTGSDGRIYTSLINGNLNHEPVSDNGTHWGDPGALSAWDATFVGGTGSVKWLQIGGAEFPNGVSLSTINVVYPSGIGPTVGDSLRNAYRLPAGYLRMAPQDPKAGINPALGAPAGLTYSDWTFEGDYFVTADADVIVLRFVADVTDVHKMDDLFCEALAARVALEVCETLTQSTTKLAGIEKLYDKFLGIATKTNAIEAGADEPPEDEYITVRA